MVVKGVNLPEEMHHKPHVLFWVVSQSTFKMSIHNWHEPLTVHASWVLGFKQYCLRSIHVYNPVLMVHGLFRHVPISTAFTVRVQWEDNTYNSTLIVRHMSSCYRLRLIQCMYMSLTMYVHNECSVIGMRLLSACTMSTVFQGCVFQVYAQCVLVYGPGPLTVYAPWIMCFQCELFMINVSRVLAYHFEYLQYIHNECLLTDMNFPE